MSAVWLIARHELRRLVVQFWPWALLAAALALLAYLFLLGIDSFLALAPKIAGRSEAPGVTDLIAIPQLRTLGNLLLLLVPLLTMPSLAGERRRHSLVLLLGAGVGELRIVLGKWLGAWLSVLVLIAFALAMPLALAAGTTLDLGRIAAAALGLALAAGALSAIGVYASALSAQPAFAAALALAMNLLLAVADTGARLQGVVDGGINYLALPTHLEPFLRGIVSSIDIVYFALLAGVMLLLAARQLAALR